MLTDVMEGLDYTEFAAGQVSRTGRLIGPCPECGRNGELARVHNSVVVTHKILLLAGVHGSATDVCLIRQKESS